MSKNSLEFTMGWRFVSPWWEKEGTPPNGLSAFVMCCGNCREMKPHGNVIHFFKGNCSQLRKEVAFKDGLACGEFRQRGVKRGKKI